MCARTCMCVHVYVCMCVCACMCVCMCVHTSSRASADELVWHGLWGLTTWAWQEGSPKPAEFRVSCLGSLGDHQGCLGSPASSWPWLIAAPKLLEKFVPWALRLELMLLTESLTSASLYIDLRCLSSSGLTSSCSAPWHGPDQVDSRSNSKLTAG